MTLSHAQNIFALEFSALSFASPARTRYRYRLKIGDGLERSSGHPRAYLHDLAGRKVHFHVQSTTITAAGANQD